MIERRLLYDFLPSLYRRRDREIAMLGDPRVAPALEALFAILQTQYDALEDDIAALYDDWFVETCALEALPLLAEPFDLPEVAQLANRGADARSLVANIVHYRQTKGTAAAFNGFAGDATGWTVQLLDGVIQQATTVRVDGSGAARPGFVRVTKQGAGAAPRSIDVRDALHGVRSAHVAVWRARSVPVEGAEAWIDPADPTGRRRTFNPLGDEVVLMRPIDRDGSSGARATVPQTRRHARQLLAEDRSADLGFHVYRLEGTERVPLAIQIEDLDGWNVPPPADGTVIADSELGRLLAHDGRPLFVDYLPIAQDGIGGAPPSRPWEGTFDATFVVGSPAQDAPAGHSGERERYQVVASFDAALARAAETPGAVRIVLPDSGTFRPLGAEWTFAPPAGSRCTLTIESAPGGRPALIGTLRLEPAARCRIHLRGVVLRGSVVAGPHAELHVTRSTLRPATPGAVTLAATAASRAGAGVFLAKTIAGALELLEGRDITIEDSIVTDAARSASSLTARRVTFLGPVRAHDVIAEDTLFDGGVRAGATHTGYVRFCLLRPRSVTPVRYGCVETARQILAGSAFGRPRFARLRDDAPAAVRRGGSEGWEIGAFAQYAEAWRVANLRRAIDEFLPDTVSARIEYRS
jgi:hypothetical protein